MQTLYKKSAFVNLDDFTVVGQTPAIVNGAIRFNPSTTGGFDNQALEIPVTRTNAEYVTITLRIKTTGTGYGGGVNYGIGMGRLSKNTWYSTPSVAVQFSPHADPPNANCWPQASGSPNTQIPTANTLTNIAPNNLGVPSTNDEMELVYSQKTNVIVFSIKNITKNQFFSRKITDNLTPTRDFSVPNTSAVRVFGLGGQFDVTSIEVRIDSPSNPNLMVIGDSKAFGYCAGSRNARWANRLAFDAGSVAVFAGNGDRSVEIRTVMEPIKAARPRQAILSFLRNDINSGVPQSTWQPNYMEIYYGLISVGTIVKHMRPIPESVQTDQGLVDNFLTSTFAASDLYNPAANFVIANHLSSDQVHPNEAGHEIIYNSIDVNALVASPPFSINGSLYKVAAGRSIRDRSQPAKIFFAGQYLGTAVLTDVDIAEHLASGFIVAA